MAFAAILVRYFFNYSITMVARNDALLVFYLNLSSSGCTTESKKEQKRRIFQFSIFKIVSHNPSSFQLWQQKRLAKLARDSVWEGENRFKIEN